MSLLSRLDRVRDKDAEFKGPSQAPGAKPADPSTPAGDTSELATQSTATGQDVASPEDAGAPPLSKPSMIKVSGGAVTSPLGAGMTSEAVIPGMASAAASTAGTGVSGGGSTALAEVPATDEVSRLFAFKHAIFDAVIGALDTRVWQQPQRDQVRQEVEKAIDQVVAEAQLNTPRGEREWLIKEFVQEIIDFGPITPLLDDPAIGKITVQSAREVWIERLGQPERTSISFRDDDHVLSLIRKIAELVGGRIDAKVPLLDRPLPEGARVRAKVPPISAHGPTLTLEKTGANPFEALKRVQAERQRTDVQPYGQLRERIQQRLIRDLDRDALAAGNQDKLRGQVEEMINGAIQEERVGMTRAERAALITDLLNEIIGLGPIEPLLNDPEIDEVMVNGPFQIYVERKGKLELTDKRFRDNNHVMQVIDRIVAPLGRRIDEKSPMVDGRLRDGSRFNAVIPPLSLTGPTMTIRKFARDPFTMTDLINFGTIAREAAQFLQAAVEARMNIVVSGGTGSGKTTTLNVLSSFIPSTERIVTIEDAAELQMRQDHVIRLETRPPNIEGAGEVTIRDLVRNALRMRPDRIVIGECRGAEAIDMLQAMNTGHDGSLTTAHANNPREMLSRLETMVLMAGMDLPVKAIREQIAGAVHIILHQDRMKDGSRRVTEITEIVGMEGGVISMQDVFKFVQESIDDNGKIHGRLQPTGLRPKYYDNIIEAGINLPVEIFTPREPDGRPGRRMIDGVR
ncbi:MAG TPA: CpaF family protein [Abditibacteriaceae bacterium]|jgi:pilus assembly protein CpaF